MECIIGNDVASIRRILTSAGEKRERIDKLLQDDASSLTDELARAMCVYSETDLGVAVHVVPRGDDNSENLGQGTTYMTVAGHPESRIAKGENLPASPLLMGD